MKMILTIEHHLVKSIAIGHPYQEMHRSGIPIGSAKETRTGRVRDRGGEPLLQLSRSSRSRSFYTYRCPKPIPQNFVKEQQTVVRWPFLNHARRRATPPPPDHLPVPSMNHGSASTPQFVSTGSASVLAGLRLTRTFRTKMQPSVGLIEAPSPMSLIVEN